MYKADLSGLSMANDAIGHAAMLTLEDGVGTLQMIFQPMTAMGLIGHLQNLWIFQGDTPTEAKYNMQNNANSDSTEYKVEATYSDLYYDTMDADDGMTPDDYAEAYQAGNTEYEPDLPAR